MSATQAGASRVRVRLVRSWWIIALAAVLGALAAAGYSATRTPVYHATASVYFSMRSATSGSDINQGSAYTQNQMLSFAQLATSTAVLERVRRELDLDDGTTDAALRRMVGVAIPQDTVILEVTAASGAAPFAAEVANATAENLTDVVYDIAPKDVEGNSTVVARVIEPATEARFQSSPDTAQDAALGFLIGGLLALLGLTLVAALDTRVRTGALLGEVSSAPVLGAVPAVGRRVREPVFAAEPRGAAAEAYRHVQAALGFGGQATPGTIAVMSAVPGEGRTKTAVNVAFALAEAGRRVALVDADLRRPHVAELLGVDGDAGLTSVLSAQLPLEDAVTSLPSGIDVLGVGPADGPPAQLLASERMQEVFAALRATHDVVVVDTPALTVSDALVLSRHVDGAIVVVDTRLTRAADLDRSLAALRAAGCDLVGFVLHGVRAPRRGRGYGASRAAAGSWIARATRSATARR